MGVRNNTESQDRPSATRRTLLTGGAVGLAAVAGSALGSAQPALAQTATPDWFNVTDYGAKGNGTHDDTSAIQSAIAAVPASGGVVYFPAAAPSYLVTSTITIQIGNSGQGPIFLVGDGRDVTVVTFTGTGACFHMYNPTFPGTGFPGIVTWGGGVKDLTIDGTNTTGQSSGLHIGDGEEYQLDLKVQNFTQSGSFGIHIDNTVWWVGRMHAKAQILNCDTAVAFDVNSNTQSSVNFGYSEYDFDIFAYQQQSGVTIQNGAHPYNSVLQIKGEWEQNSNSTKAGTFLTVTGNYGTSGPASQLTDCVLNAWTEMNNTGGGKNPQTVLLGSSGNKIKGCHGQLVFINSTQQGAWQSASGFTVGQDQFGFYGEVIGDTTLAPDSTQGNTTPLQLAGAPVLYAPGFINGSSGTLYMGNGDFFQATLGGSTTVTLAWGNQSLNPQAGPQRKTIVLSQPGSTLHKVAWPQTSTPSLNSPTVLWAGGTPPTMTQKANATDVYYLETCDGITWYGLASQNVS